MFEGPIAAVGEVMVELSELDAPGGRVRMSFAGDSYNTAVYLARLLGADGPRVDYVTALGQDALSERILGAMRAEGVGTGRVARLRDRLPGIYAIETDETGERSFVYWRETSAARAMFSPEGLDPAVLADYGTVHLSGITLAILPEADRERLMDRLRLHRDRGGSVVFDTNYRPGLWTSADEARRWMAAAMSTATLAFPSIDDETTLFGEADADAILSRIKGYGVDEIALKRGAKGPVVRSGGATVAPDCPPVRTVVDTTAAGDAFDAGYLAARIRGETPERAARAGHALASQVIGYRGAIMPRDVPLAR